MKIVRTRVYERSLKRLGASTEDVARLERSLASNPLVGDVIPGLRGVRKVRFRLGGRGKRGGGRAVYVAMVGDEVVVMLLAYAKGDKSDLTPEDKRVLLRLLEELGDA